MFLEGTLKNAVHFLGVQKVEERITFLGYNVIICRTLYDFLLYLEGEILDFQAEKNSSESTVRI